MLFADAGVLGKLAEPQIRAAVMPVYVIQCACNFSGHFIIDVVKAALVIQHSDDLAEKAAAYQAVSVNAKEDTIKGETQWLKNNIVSVVLFSIAAVMLILIIILLVVKPSDETLEDVENGKKKKKKSKKDKKSELEKLDEDEKK